MTSSALVRPLLLGLATGLRSQIGLAALAWSGPGPRDPGPLKALRSPAGKYAVGLAAAGELVGDKLPNTPSRLKAPVLGSRLVAGALVGALAAGTDDRRTLALAGGIGLAGAAAGTYAGAAYRKVATSRTGLPDLPFALVEDVVAVGLAGTAAQLWPQPRPWWKRLPGSAR